MLTFIAGGCISLASCALASVMAGSYLVRALSIAFFLLAAGGINTAIEASIFTTLGGNLFVACMWFLPGLLTGLTAAGLIKPAMGQGRWDGFTPGRLVAAWGCFPTVYWAFGTLISPFVLPYYNVGGNGGLPFLHIPPTPLILEVQAARSLLFLTASLPFLAFGVGSNKTMALVLGWAHYTVVDLYGTFMGTFLPIPLRMAHGVEILGDSMVYGALLVLLLRPAPKR